MNHGGLIQFFFWTIPSILIGVLPNWVLLNCVLQTAEPAKKNFYNWNLSLFLYDSNDILYISVLSFQKKKRICQLSCIYLIVRNTFRAECTVGKV